MIKNMEKGLFFGMMEKNLLELGLKVFKVVLAYSFNQIIHIE